MSRTIRNIRKWSIDEDTVKIIKGGDKQVNHNAWGNRKMPPYATTPSVFKDRATKTCHVNGFMKGVSKYDKLITKNANRSLKKSIRQQLKNELKKELENG